MTGSPQSLVRAARAGGAGWQASFIETMVAEYKWPLRKVIWGISLTAAFTLLGTRAVRLGDDTRPGHGDAAADAARVRVKEYFEKHYRIV